MAVVSDSYGAWFPTRSTSATTLASQKNTTFMSAAGSLTLPVPGTPWLVSHGGKEFPTRSQVLKKIIGQRKQGQQQSQEQQVRGTHVRVVDLSRGPHAKSNPMSWKEFPLSSNNMINTGSSSTKSSQSSSSSSLSLPPTRRFYHSGYVTKTRDRWGGDTDWTVGESPEWLPLALLRNHSLCFHGGIDERGVVQSGFFVFDFGSASWRELFGNRGTATAAPAMYGHQVVPLMMPEVDLHDNNLWIPHALVIGIPEELVRTAQRRQLILRNDDDDEEDDDAEQGKGAKGDIAHRPHDDASSQKVPDTQSSSLAVFLFSEASGWHELPVIGDRASALAPRRHFSIAQVNDGNNDELDEHFAETAVYFMVGGVSEVSLFESAGNGRSGATSRGRRSRLCGDARRETGTHHEMPVLEITWHRAHSPAAHCCRAAGNSSIGSHVVFRQVVGPWQVVAPTSTMPSVQRPQHHQNRVSAPPSTVLPLQKLRRHNWLLSAGQDAATKMMNTLLEKRRAAIEWGEETKRTRTSLRRRHGAQQLTMQPVAVRCFSFAMLGGVEKLQPLLRLGESVSSIVEARAVVAEWLAAQVVGAANHDMSSNDNNNNHNSNNNNNHSASKLCDFTPDQWKGATFFFVNSPVCIDIFAIVPQKETAEEKSRRLKRLGNHNLRERVDNDQQQRDGGGDDEMSEAAQLALLIPDWPPVLPAAPIYVPLACVEVKKAAGVNNSRGGGGDDDDDAMDSVSLSELPEGTKVLFSAVQNRESHLELPYQQQQQQQPRHSAADDLKPGNGAGRETTSSSCSQSAVYSTTELGRVFLSVACSSDPVVELGLAIVKSISRLIEADDEQEEEQVDNEENHDDDNEERDDNDVGDSD